jgi:EAL domain-containing protein (putative c-di-GMP-specific phosphodiesterase class I)
MDHFDELASMGCEVAQGFGIARPMPADKISAWVQEWENQAQAASSAA